MEADIRPLEPDEPVSRVGRTGVRITTDSQTARARSARSTPPTRYKKGKDSLAAQGKRRYDRESTFCQQFREAGGVERGKRRLSWAGSRIFDKNDRASFQGGHEQRQVLGCRSWTGGQGGDGGHGLC
jgi:hypothetical protein